jgi:hypothetical protein
MRSWLLALASLTLVALTSPIAAGDKRTSALAVRVTVVRSCSVNTESGGVTAGMVTCGSRFGPPVMSASSTITVPLSGTSPTRLDAASAAPIPVPREGSAPSQPAPEPAVVERVAQTTANTASSASTASSRIIPRSPEGTSGGDDVAADPEEVVAFRVVTVNF